VAWARCAWSAVVGRVGAQVSDDVDNPTGNKILWDSGFLNGAPHKVRCAARACASAPPAPFSCTCVVVQRKAHICVTVSCVAGQLVGP
jgi:hypothetical protein